VIPMITVRMTCRAATNGLIPDPRPIPGAKGSNRRAWRFRGQAAEKASVFRAGNRLETGLPLFRILEESRQKSDARAVGITSAYRDHSAAYGSGPGPF